MHWLTYIAIIVGGFAGLRLVVVLVNLFSYRRLSSDENVKSSSLAVLIPVRNEESNIANILSDLNQQANLNFEILVYDDLS